MSVWTLNNVPIDIVADNINASHQGISSGKNAAIQFTLLPGPEHTVFRIMTDTAGSYTLDVRGFLEYTNQSGICVLEPISFLAHVTDTGMNYLGIYVLNEPFALSMAGNSVHLSIAPDNVNQRRYNITVVFRPVSIALSAVTLDVPVQSGKSIQLLD